MSDNDSLVGFTSTPQALDCGSELVLLCFGSIVLGTSFRGNTTCLSAIALIKFAVLNGLGLQ